jgi:hypothetical protein
VQAVFDLCGGSFGSDLHSDTGFLVCQVDAGKISLLFLVQVSQIQVKHQVEKPAGNIFGLFVDVEIIAVIIHPDF